MKMRLGVLLPFLLRGFVTGREADPVVWAGSLRAVMSLTTPPEERLVFWRRDCDWLSGEETRSSASCSGTRPRTGSWCSSGWGAVG